MFDPSTGRWFEEDPKGFAAGDPNLYRYVKNNPTRANDPSGLEERLLIQSRKYDTPKGALEAAFAKGQTEALGPVTGAEQWISEDFLQYTLTDNKLGYSMVCDFVVHKDFIADKRYVLQAMRIYTVVVTPDKDGNLKVSWVINPDDRNAKPKYVYYKIDQSAGTVAAGGRNWPDQREMDYPGGIVGGIPITPNPEKLIPAVFAIQVIEGTAGLSILNYRPLRKGGAEDGPIRSNSLAIEADYKYVISNIDKQRTDTSSYYVFYNPKNGKDPKNPVSEESVLGAIKAADPELEKVVKQQLAGLKITLKDKPFEFYLYPSQSQQPRGNK
jgi:hypothetical protein